MQLGLESVFATVTSSKARNQNNLFHASFFYKPHKKLFIRASLLNLFNEKFFTTNSSNSNFISQSSFTLRPRQFTVGLNYTL